VIEVGKGMPETLILNNNIVGYEITTSIKSPSPLETTILPFFLAIGLPVNQFHLLGLSGIGDMHVFAWNFDYSTKVVNDKKLVIIRRPFPIGTPLVLEKTERYYSTLIYHFFLKFRSHF